MVLDGKELLLFCLESKVMPGVETIGVEGSRSPSDSCKCCLFDVGVDVLKLKLPPDILKLLIRPILDPSCDLGVDGLPAPIKEFFMRDVNDC